MIPHRITLALVALVAAGASVSCLDERVRVPVRAAAVDDGYSVKPLPLLDLVVRKAQPFGECEETRAGCLGCPKRNTGCGEQRLDPSRANAAWCFEHNDENGRSNLVARKTTSLDGTASFDLVPGDYEICSEGGAQLGGKQFAWAVPFRVGEDGAWEVARAERRGGELVWVYPKKTGDENAQLLLSNDNAPPRAPAAAQPPVNNTQAAEAQAKR